MKPSTRSSSRCLDSRILKNISIKGVTKSYESSKATLFWNIVGLEYAVKSNSTI